MTSGYPTNQPDPWNERPTGQPPSYGAQPPYPQTPSMQPPYGAQPGQPAWGQPVGQPYGQPYSSYAAPQAPWDQQRYGFWQAPVPGGQRASMAARFGGLLIDGLITGVPTVIAGIFTGAYDRPEGSCEPGERCTSFAFHFDWKLQIFSLVLSLSYVAYFVGVQGRTPGHRAAGIRVVDVHTGGVIGPWRAIGRQVVLTLTGALCTLGYWSPYFDSERRQGWHDKATRAVVIPNQPSAFANQPGGAHG
jgi:uncharacterized RDD family membrane protein YckC